MWRFVTLFIFALCCFARAQEDDHRPSSALLEDYDDVSGALPSPMSVQFAQQRKVVPETLAFLTPWNRKGYDMRVPFQFLAPVWFRLTPQEHMINIDGAHDVNSAWMKEIREMSADSNQKSYIVPRVSLEGFSSTEHYKALFITHRERVLRHISIMVERHALDGITLELGFIHYNSYSSLVTSFLSALRKHFTQLTKKHGKPYFIVLVLPSQEDLIGPKEMLKFSKWVDRFFVMTYDYSVHQSRLPGPIAPIKWVETTLNRLCPPKGELRCSQILMGINYYGYDYGPTGPNPITGERLLEIVRKEKQVRTLFDYEAKERYIEYHDAKNSLHKVFYPSAESVSIRVQLAKRLGFGIGIWEIGQGIDEFMEEITEPYTM